MTSSLGLSDTQRTYLEIGMGALASAQAFIIANNFIGDQPVSPAAIWILALVIAVIAPVKAFLGVRDSSTSRVTKEVNADLSQHRKVGDDQLAPSKK